ncbi:FIP (Fungus-Induced Protein) Related [Caenorhabditis elegans]|uniref:FIP (Fungus-Induced Protein) Related n=1 Tax=Caenorhabditis elegans TaxID=6239 RepID=A0A2K5ATK4_CAEEL|nr:FIP (Fungus-Induced Protein) Related [Caenorhabditis elegans]SPC47109.1 FIP (Fungus-Induced Protein) Related [Caenorhabditis elegans]|eukprot:NP_001348657.1 Uncharacterized protein CELE_ZC262.13 [Caenorhabditis elegans]
MTQFLKILFLLLLLVPLISSASTRGQCLTDRNCDSNHKCVNRHCFYQNEHVFKCVDDLTCPEFHSCHNRVCLMQKSSPEKRIQSKI